MEQIEQYKLEGYELKQKLELAMKELREASEETRKLTEQKQHAESLVEAKEREHRKQVHAVASHFYPGVIKNSC